MFSHSDRLLPCCVPAACLLVLRYILCKLEQRERWQLKEGAPQRPTTEIKIPRPRAANEERSGICCQPPHLLLWEG